MPALLPLVPWLAGGAVIGATGWGISELGDGFDKLGNGMLKGAVAGALIYVVVKKVK